MQEKETMFSAFWYTTLLFWGFSGLIAVCGEIATGIVMMFAGPPVSFIITVLVFSVVSLLRGKPSEKTGGRPDDGPGGTGDPARC